MNFERFTAQLEELGIMAWLNKAAAVYLPLVLKLIAVLIVGHILTRLLARLVARLCERFKLDALSERIGIQEVMRRVGLGVPSLLLPKIIRVLGLTATFYLAADILQIEVLSRAIGATIAFVPTLLTALAIVLAGLVGAETVKKIIAKVLSVREGLSDVSHLIAQGVYVTIMVLTLAMAAQQLGLDISLINRIILLTVIGVAIGIAGSLGLGATPLLEQLVARYHALRIFELDDLIELDGQRARIVRFAPMVAILELDAGVDDSQTIERLFVPYHALIASSVIRERREEAEDI